MPIQSVSLVCAAALLLPLTTGCGAADTAGPQVAGQANASATQPSSASRPYSPSPSYSGGVKDPAASGGAQGSGGAPKHLDSQVVAKELGSAPTEAANGTLRVTLTRVDPEADPKPAAKGKTGASPATTAAALPDPAKTALSAAAAAGFLGIGSWATFAPDPKEGREATLAGELFLLEDEVNPVLSAALLNGLDVTALHEKYGYDKGPAYSLYLAGEGGLAKLAAGVHAALDAQKAVRKAHPKPLSEAPIVPATSHLDGGRLDAALGVHGQLQDGMYKVAMGRHVTGTCGCVLGEAEGVGSGATFAGENGAAVVRGDLAVTEPELQDALRALRAGGMEMTGIDHALTGEYPRLLFVHYYGRGAAEALARAIREATNTTAWDGKQ